jgi:hypothetical protein
VTTSPDHNELKGAAHDELPDYHEDSSHPSPPPPGWLSNKAKIRKFLIRGTLLVLIFLFGPPVYRALKNWRSEVLLERSGKAFAVGDPQGGVTLLKKALALSPGSVVIQQAVQLYDARAGDKPSLEILLGRMRQGESSPEELLGLAEIELHAGEKVTAQEVVTHLPVHLNSEQLLRRYLIESALMAEGGQIAQAADLCIAKARELGGDDASRLRIQGALFLMNLGMHADQESVRKAKELLESVVSEHSGASLVAWRILARLEVQSPAGMDKQADTGLDKRLISEFTKLKRSSVTDQLIDADLQIRADPSCKEALIKKLTLRYAQADRSEMLEYARWLNVHGMRDEVISFAGANRPSSDTDWLLIVLDAKSGLGRWNEVGDMLTTPAAAGIPDAIRHLYLARSAMMMGNQTVAEEEWRNVGGALSLEKPETLAYVAGYEEQIGVYDRAARTYREMADRKESKVQGLIGLIRCQPRNESAKKLIPLYEELLQVSPDYADAQGDLAYLKLLTGEDMLNASKTAERLLSANPRSLARISTAALARLKNGDTKGALFLYQGKAIDWNTASDPWKAIYLEVLKANGDPNGLIPKMPTINMDLLRPEEVALLNKAES